MSMCPKALFCHCMLVFTLYFRKLGSSKKKYSEHTARCKKVTLHSTRFRRLLLLYCVLLPTPTFSIYSRAKRMWGAASCVFIPGHVWPGRLPRVKVMADQSSPAEVAGPSGAFNQNNGEPIMECSALHRSHLIGYYQEADWRDGE